MGPIKLVWLPQWFCQNYTPGRSFGTRCPYCPYGFDTRSNRLIYDGRLSGSNALAAYEDVLGFFRANADAVGRTLEVSGGEPLLYPHLDRMLGTEGISHGWQWAITSNTLNRPMIERVIAKSGGRIDGCISWTASYHPFSGEDERFAANVRLVRAHSGAALNATVVVSALTLDRLPAAHAFLATLPFDRVQWHVDAHGAADPAALRETAEALLGPVPAYAGAAPQGVLCDRHDRLLAVTPDGLLFECVTKAYQNLDPVGRVSARLLVADLPRRVEYCDLACFAVCDHVKHTARVGIQVGGRHLRVLDSEPQAAVNATGSTTVWGSRPS